MRIRSILCIVASLLASVAAADDAPRLVRVELRPGLGIHELLAAGLDVVEVEPLGAALVLEWPNDAGILSRLGASTTLVDADPGATAARLAQFELEHLPRPPGTIVRSATGPDGEFRTEVLPPFGFGAMGGFWSLDEIKMKLDLLVANDALDLVADKVDTIGYSLQGRPIWGLEIGHGLEFAEGRPVVFYNALTHAREPEGMQALFYFVDDLLSKFNVNLRSNELLDYRTLYIVPCVNPDSYRQNQIIRPQGGGMIRKNQRPPDGVDLNRNYGYAWGYDNVGSSPNPTDENYRGSAAWSEPETVAQRDIVTQLQPRTCFSIHTYGELLLRAWAHRPEPILDGGLYHDLGGALCQHTLYSYGPFYSELYPANGEFNDWAYGDSIAKPRAYSWTPEIGSEGFWPPPSSIVPQALLNLESFYLVAEIADAHVRKGFIQIPIQPGRGRIGKIQVEAENIGSRPANELIATLTSPTDPSMWIMTGTVAYPNLSPLQRSNPVGNAFFTVTAADTATPGRKVPLTCRFTTADGTMVTTDTVVVTISSSLVDVEPLSGSPFELSTPHPNPLDAEARFEFSLPTSGTARLEVLDAQGRRVVTLADGPMPAGRHDRVWDLSDRVGRRVKPGIYFVALSQNAERRIRRVAVLK